MPKFVRDANKNIVEPNPPPLIIDVVAIKNQLAILEAQINTKTQEFNNDLAPLVTERNGLQARLNEIKADVPDADVAISAEEIIK